VSTSSVPPSVLRHAAGETIEIAWANEEGTTYRLGSDRFLKWRPHTTGVDLRPEAERMRWARAHVPVPEVLELGADELGSWLLTAALDGESAVSSRWVAEPEIAVAAIGRGLRTLHDNAPVARCPFSWSVEDRGGSSPPPIDHLVVCHGDACSPNTILRADGSVSGLVDLGQLGVADRWADLAVATWATEWNYGPGWEEHLLHAYGIVPDPIRTAYYRQLWDAT